MTLEAARPSGSLSRLRITFLFLCVAAQSSSLSCTIWVARQEIAAMLALCLDKAVVFFFAKTVRRPDSPAQTFQCCVSPAWTCLFMCQGVNRLGSLPRLGRCCAQLLQVLVLGDNQQLPVRLLLRGVLVEALRPQKRPGLRREAASEQQAVMRYRAKQKIHCLDICCATVLPAAAAAGVAIAGSPPDQTSGTEVSRRRRCGCVCSMR